MPHVPDTGPGKRVTGTGARTDGREASRQTSEVGAVCRKAARTVLCGGRPVMGVPTAIGGSARRFVCPLSSLLASAPPAKAKGADPSRASRGATYRATSSRHGGRHHPGTPSEIKSECRARSSRVRKRLPPGSAGMPFWRSMFRRKRRKAVARNFQAARHDATKLTKALPERAPPTSKGCRRLAASSRLAEQCSAVSSGDSALPAHEFFGLGLGERTR